MLNESVVRDLSKHEPSLLQERRKNAFKQFNELAMPSFRYGIGIFVDVSDLHLEEVDPLEKKDEEILVRSEEIEVLSLEKALEIYPEMMQEYFQKKGEKYLDKLSALHDAFVNHSLVIKIPENTMLKDPIQLSLNLKAHTRIETIIVIAEKNSKAVIIEAATSEEEEIQIFRSQRIDVFLRENAQLEYRSLQHLNATTYHFAQRNAFGERDSFMYWIDCWIGGKFTQSITKTFLKEVGATSKSWGVVFGDKTQCFDLNTETLHEASRTTSDMLTKVVLNDRAKTVYRGLIKIHPLARGCEGYQKDDTILLSEHAKADAVPNLEIANNDVKCSHGATISQIDEEKLFYMQSRGLNEQMAKQSIIEGFFEPIVVQLGDEKLQKEIMHIIAQRLGEKK